MRKKKILGIIWKKENTSIKFSFLTMALKTMLSFFCYLHLPFAKLIFSIFIFFSFFEVIINSIIVCDM
jgi:hypothetical protein